MDQPLQPIDLLATPFKVELVCIPPDQVKQFWPHVRAMLLGAIHRVGISLSEDIERDVLGGLSLLWIVWNGRNIESAAVTQLSRTDTGTVCVVVACAGLARGRWLHLLGKIENYARQEGCRSIRIFGREGWKKVLPEYKQIAVVIEKGLS